MPKISVMARSWCLEYRSLRTDVSWSSSRAWTLQFTRRRRCRRDGVPSRGFPGHLLLAQRVLAPGPQHSPLHHHEEKSGADDAVSLERTDESTSGREHIKPDLSPKHGPVERLASQEDGCRQDGQQQKWHDEAQEFMARELKGESAIAEWIQQIQVSHQNCDSSEKGPGLSTHLGLRRHKRDEPAQRRGI